MTWKISGATLKKAEEDGAEFIMPPPPKVGPARYSGNEGYIAISLGAIVRDLIPIAGDWGVEHEVLSVLEKHNGVIDTPEAFRELMARISPSYRATARSRYVPPSIRDEVYRRDGEECVVCGSGDDLSLDHIKPFSRGGRHTPSNLRVLCRSCNSEKGDRTDEEWLADG